jgi:hypothetical protein
MCCAGVPIMYLMVQGMAGQIAANGNGPLRDVETAAFLFEVEILTESAEKTIRFHLHRRDAETGIYCEVCASSLRFPNDEKKEVIIETLQEALSSLQSELDRSPEQAS